MKEINLTISGLELDFDTARAMATTLAEQDDQETMLVAWYDESTNNHSPCCVKCQIGDTPGWEVYGRNHGGRLRIDINDGAYIFIQT
ncbi:MAG: AF1514 family protein [Desulfobulbaceae bacterium]|nr:AF1514 family protein [Desulfobulbaceae bacterium]